MTVDREKFIKIPIWLVSVLLPGIIALVTALTVFSATKATLEQKAIRNEQEIQKMDADKIDRNELNLIINTLNRIENKIDQHIDQK